MKTSTLVFYYQQKQTTFIYRLPGEQLIQTHQCYSFSTILSLGAYIVWKFPKLPCVGIDEQVEPLHREETFPDRLACSHPMYNHWIDFLVQQVISGNALRMGETLYFKISVSQDFADLLKLSGFKEEVIQHKMSWQSVFPDLHEEELRSDRRHRNVMMLVCTLVSYDLPSFHAPALFMGMFYNNQNWKKFRIMKNEFPTQEDFDNVTQIIVPGSPLCISINIEPQIQRVIDALRDLFKKTNQVKYLGICYGHQLLSEVMAAGCVRAAKGRTYGLETINFVESETTSKFNFLTGIQKANAFELHGDEVSFVPDGFTKIATSESCAIEGMLSNDGRILTLQCHPEYTMLRAKSLIATKKMKYEQIGKSEMLQIINEPNRVVDQSSSVQEVLRRFLNL